MPRPAPVTKAICPSSLFMDACLPVFVQAIAADASAQRGRQEYLSQAGASLAFRGEIAPCLHERRFALAFAGHIEKLLIQVARERPITRRARRAGAAQEAAEATGVAVQRSL